jgi:NADPH-dependent 2,4-dienoyl-CoA reductase/sulfur reductase-like enzyme
LIARHGASKCASWRPGREYGQTYDALILSTGASPLRPPIPGIERPNHFVVRKHSRCGKNHGVVEGLRALVAPSWWAAATSGSKWPSNCGTAGSTSTVAQGPPQVMTPFDR